MIKFVNAKINIGLQITERRPDGYHNLQTVFYPIGKYAGTHDDPAPFCDILECFESESSRGILLRGRTVDCPLEKNLVYKAARLFFEKTGRGEELTICLEKHLPDGAGLGGGSADASFTLRMLAEYYGLENLPLEEWTATLGADCPFFIRNSPVYAEGIGERMTPIALNLSGFWMAVVKPDVYVSTKDAFSGVTPKAGEFDLRKLPEMPIEEWHEYVKNDFEDSIFPKIPVIAEVKQYLYDKGALYASMSGSGSSVYGIFSDKSRAAGALDEMRDNPTIAALYLLKM